jgi:hypothetical protein
MSYKVIATHCKYSREGALEECTVLFDCNALSDKYIDIRATRWSLKNNNPGQGYLYLSEADRVLSPELLQRVAGQCYQIEIAEMKKMFGAEVKETMELHKRFLKANPTK